MPGALLNVPHFKQEFNYSCIAASARMVLAHHGRIVTESDLRNLLETQPTGTRARNLESLAGLGFDVHLDSSSLTNLREALAAELAPIVFVDTGQLDYWEIDCAHVAVIVGIDDEAVYLNDPFFESAPQRTSLPQFLHAWALNSHLAAIIRPRS
jgi:ABC-type bacteriocin/lantibiotic exporter with double-glycine peptidase domain